MSTPMPQRRIRGPELAPCGSSSTLFSIAPLALDDVTSIFPLGNLNPTGHTFPTRHMYFHIRTTDPSDPASPKAEVPLVAPGDLVITSISTSQNLTRDPPLTDYSVRFAACEEFTGYFLHVNTITEKLQDQFTPPFDWCNEYSTGGDIYRNCGKRLTIEMKAGEPIGTAGGPGHNALDFGASDTRVPPLQFANPSRWQGGRYVVCPLDYFEPGLRDALYGLLGDGAVLRTIAPICGEVEQDEPGTAQGAWFAAGAAGGNEDPHLALVHDNSDPSIGVFSIGTSLGAIGVPAGLYHFDPTSSGPVNREFRDVTADDRVYCYEIRLRFARPESPPTVVTLQLTGPATLRVGIHAAGACGPGPWAQGSTIVDFER